MPETWLSCSAKSACMSSPLSCIPSISKEVFGTCNSTLETLENPHGVFAMTGVSTG